MSKISILMPIYNCEKYIEYSIESILKQTWEDYEFVIVDDGSTDKSLSIVKSYHDPRIKIISCISNGGVAKARNIGLKACSTDYIALMDADDIAHEDRIQKQFLFLESHPEVDAVYSRWGFIDENGKSINGTSPMAYYNPKYIRAYMLFNNVIGNAGTMFRRSIIKKYNIKYDESCEIASDYKFWCDYVQYGNFKGMDEILWEYRVRKDSLYNGSALEKCLKYERKIRLYNLGKYGFCLRKEELDILLYIFGYGRIKTKNEMILFYEALNSMVIQAYENNLDFKDEIKIMCKKRFDEKIQDAEELWIV